MGPKRPVCRRKLCTVGVGQLTSQRRLDFNGKIVTLRGRSLSNRTTNMRALKVGYIQASRLFWAKKANFRQIGQLIFQRRLDFKGKIVTLCRKRGRSLSNRTTNMRALG